MLNAFHCSRGEYASKRQLADEAIRLERELCREADVPVDEHYAMRELGQAAGIQVGAAAAAHLADKFEVAAQTVLVDYVERGGYVVESHYGGAMI